MIELHVHLDGSLRPETIWELAEKQGEEAPAADLAGLRAMMQAPVPCGGLSEYLSRFALPLRYLQTEAALERVAFELTEDMAGEGITYGEIRFAPQLSTEKGLSQAEVVKAVAEGVSRGMTTYPGIKIGLLLCCMRGDDERTFKNNMETIETAACFKEDGETGKMICGVDLAGAEELYSTSLFTDLFKEADRYGLKRTIHAGEAAGPDSMWAALELGALRIGHGIAAVQDETLIKELVRRQTVLEVCVTSNVQTRGTASLNEHPIRKLYDAGVHVTLNTDNRTVSGTTLLKEIELAKRMFGFADEDIKRMEGYAAKGAFCNA